MEKLFSTILNDWNPVHIDELMTVVGEYLHRKCFMPAEEEAAYCEKTKSDILKWAETAAPGDKYKASSYFTVKFVSCEFRAVIHRGCAENNKTSEKIVPISDALIIAEEFGFREKDAFVEVYNDQGTLIGKALWDDKLRHYRKAAIL